MAIRTVTYSTRAERDALVATAEAQGETMVRDDHHQQGRGVHEMDFEVLGPTPPHVDTPVEVIEFQILRNPSTVIFSDLVTLEVERLRERNKV